MDSSMIEKLSFDVSAYDMPETDKLGSLVQALVAEDEDTGVECTGYGVYAVSSSSYGIMF